MIPTNLYTHYSIQQAFCHIPELVKKAKELGFTQLAITDKHTLSGCSEFHREMVNNDMLPILGCEFTLPDGNEITLLAQNKKGWQNLIKILGRTQIRDGIECVLASDITELSNDLVAIINDNAGDDNDEIKHCYQGRIFYHEDYPVYYIEQEDHIYQKILLCSHHKITLNEIDELNELPEYDYLINNNNCYLKAPTEYKFNDANLFEEYSIAEKPIIPQSKKTNDPDSFLKELCREGWYKRGLDKKCKDKTLLKAYGDRVKNELQVFEEAGLANYMLIIHDIINYGKEKGIEIGLRGSAAGCLVSYLMGISDVDPMMPDPTLEFHPDRALIFERFYNSGRNTDGHISMPDIDVDIPISFREDLITYVEETYGANYVGHIITFSRLDGRGAIKEIFRILDPVSNSFELANDITKYMVDTAKIQDVLQDIKEEKPDYTVINYCIDHIQEVKDYYVDYKQEFDIAIKLSKTISHTGKHAAGIVIGDRPLGEMIPTKIDEKTGKRMVALEMQEAEYCGAVKYDFLGVAALEKISAIQHMLENNLMEPIVGNFSFKDIA